MTGSDNGVSDAVASYGVTQTLVRVLEMCGHDLTRANVMKQAIGLKEFAPDRLLPGNTINKSATDFASIKQLQIRRFKGDRWELMGELIGDDPTN